MLFLQPFLSNAASHSSEHLQVLYLSLVLPFVLFVLFSLFSMLCVFFLFLLWSGLLCCVPVPGTLAFHLPHLDVLRLFGLTDSDSQSVTK